MSTREQYYSKLLCQSQQKELEDYKRVLLILGEDPDEIDSCFTVYNGQIILDIVQYAKLLGYPEELKIPHWVNSIQVNKNKQRR